MNDDNRQVITPMLCGGYCIPIEDREIKAEFHPAINQIWIKGKPSDDKLALIHAHETMHVSTISSQPSQLLLLRAELLGTIDRPSKDCFVDIVETVCEACFWAMTNLDVDDISNLTRDTLYPVHLATLFNLSRNILEKNSIFITKENLKEVVIGICMLLLNIIPNQPNKGLEILNVISNLDFPTEIENRWHLYYDLYWKLDCLWKNINNYKELFTLMLPIDSHRYVSDMILFINAALCSLHRRPRTITAVFPVLLLLISQATFMLLPTVYVKNDDGQYKAIIKIIHSSAKSEEITRDAVSLQEMMIKRNEEKGIHCGAASVFLRLVKEAHKYKMSSSKDRTKECFSELLSLLPDQLNTHVNVQNNCPGCQMVFQGEVFHAALENIINTPQALRHKIINLTGLYDNFLKTDLIRIIHDYFQLPSVPKLICDYEYL